MVQLSAQICNLFFQGIIEWFPDHCGMRFKQSEFLEFPSTDNKFFCYMPNIDDIMKKFSKGSTVSHNKEG